jgi:asparagine synthase (glutamine-hydrolysing)
MSGIVSLVNHSNEPINLSLLRQMTDSLEFRGPDGREIWAAGHVGLGQTLLRSTDEQRHEKQPFTLDNQVWIVGDVRLDGQSDLLAALQAKAQGISEGTPDVELVLHSYYIWDSACVEHLQGDFAFILWDNRQQKLFCGRDQFGITPFYYAHIGDTLICSNTLNCIRLHPQISDALDKQVVADFLLWGMNMDWSPTIFKDIQRLPPAHTLTWQAGQIQIQRYWQLPRTRPLIFYKRPQEYVEHFSSLFEQAISDRLRTKRIATHLSGGMDSTSIAATAQKILLERGDPFEFQAFTQRDRLMMPDEDSLAHMVAHYIGIPLTEVNLEGYICKTPPERPEMLFPEPIAIPARFPITDFTQRCADHARVVLTGLGGDPALRFGEFYWLEWWKHGLRRETLAAYWHYLLTHRSRKLYLRHGLTYWRKVKKEEVPLPSWINGDCARQLNLQSRYAKFNAETADNISRYGMANVPFWSNVFEQFDPGVTGIAVKHYHPFFDLRLVDFLISIPPIPWLVDKKLLRESVKHRLPEATRTRRKTVFQAPDAYTKQLREAVGVWAGDLLKNTPEVADYVNTSELLKLLESGEIDTATFMGLEKTLAVAYWLRNYKTTPEMAKLEAISC